MKSDYKVTTAINSM